MKGIRLDFATMQKIYKLGQKTPRLSNREIAKQVGIPDHTTVARYRDVKPVAATAEEMPENVLHFSIKKLLKKSPHSRADLAQQLKLNPSRIKAAIKDMVSKGAMIAETHGLYDLTPSFAAPAGRSEISSQRGKFGEFTHVFGAISDNHLCNKHSRLDVLNAAYKTYERMGITDVYNGGNWIDGEARFNKTELVTAPGMDNQLDYMIDKYPQVKGITTHYVAGDDHEGWYQQREGVEIGRYLQGRAKEQGRHDLRYLGYGEADVSLRHGSGCAIMRVVHPGGGSSYAISYTDQKRVESYQGGEKPHIELAAHYHKAGYFYPREVHCVQTACTEDQTMFMRKKKIQAMVGYWVIKVAQDSNGAITRFAPEFFPFYDRGYYRRDF